jgi:uncharacterized protein involved in type VI secretion and phage assembly
MAASWFEFGIKDKEPSTDRIFGVANATVLDNIDLLGEGRIQISLPWLPGFQPWARIATPMAGSSCGAYFMPQIGDEVLVAFNHGDVREPYILGALWNTIDRPPALLTTDPVSKRIIRTPTGQEISFDDLQQTITISNSLQQTLSLGPATASLSAGSSQTSVTLSLTGQVTISAATSITLKAPSIVLNGTTVSITGSSSAVINGGTSCSILGAQVSIG